MKLPAGKTAKVTSALGLLGASALAVLLVIAGSGESEAATATSETTVTESPNELPFAEEVTTTTLREATPQTTVVQQPDSSTSESQTIDGFANCTEASDAGITDIEQGQAGFQQQLDRDNDGIACEEDQPNQTDSQTATTSPPAPTTTITLEAEQTTTTASQTTQPATTSRPISNNANAVELEIHRLVNELRTNPNGPLARQSPIPASCPLQPNLPTLQLNGTVSDVLARDWATQMASNGRLEHRPLQQQRSMLESTGVSFSTWGENIAFQMGFRNGRGETDQQIALRFFEGWRESDSHFCNMTNPRFTATGIGHFADGATDKDWATQNFYG